MEKFLANCFLLVAGGYIGYKLAQMEAEEAEEEAED